MGSLHSSASTFHTFWHACGVFSPWILSCGFILGSLEASCCCSTSAPWGQSWGFDPPSPGHAAAAPCILGLTYHCISGPMLLLSPPNSSRTPGPKSHPRAASTRDPDPNYIDLCIPTPQTLAPPPQQVHLCPNPGTVVFLRMYLNPGPWLCCHSEWQCTRPRTRKDTQSYSFFPWAKKNRRISAAFTIEDLTISSHHGHWQDLHTYGHWRSLQSSPLLTSADEA